jgi:hypothetical protein
MMAAMLDLYARRRIPRRLLPTVLLGWLVFAAPLGLAACSRIMGPKASQPVPSYPDGPAGLEAMFRDVLTAAKADERERVHDYFQSLKMTPSELGTLFGPQAAELQKPYDDMMATLIHRGAVELVGIVYEKKYDTVEVVPMTLPALSDLAQPAGGAAAPAPGSTAAPRPEDLALARALVAHPTLYSVRFKKNGEALGNRYDFLFYVDGHWRTGNQLGKILARRAAELTAAPTAR